MFFAVFVSLNFVGSCLQASYPLCLDYGSQKIHPGSATFVYKLKIDEKAAAALQEEKQQRARYQVYLEEQRRLQDRIASKSKCQASAAVGFSSTNLHRGSLQRSQTSSDLSQLGQVSHPAALAGQIVYDDNNTDIGYSELSLSCSAASEISLQELKSSVEPVSPKPRRRGQLARRRSFIVESGQEF